MSDFLFTLIVTQFLSFCRCFTGALVGAWVDEGLKVGDTVGLSVTGDMVGVDREGETVGRTVEGESVGVSVDGDSVGREVTGESVGSPVGKGVWCLPWRAAANQAARRRTRKSRIKR